MKKSLLLIFSFSLVLTLNFLAFSQQEQSFQPQDKNIEKADLVAKAKNLLLSARKAKSEKPLSEIKDIKTISSVQLLLGGNGFEATNETTIKFPNKTLSVISGPFGVIKNAYNGEIAWTQTPGGIQELVGDKTLEFQNVLAGDPISILNNFDQQNYQVTFLDENTWQEQSVNTVLLTTNTGHEIKVYLEPKTNMIIGKSSQAKVGGNTFTNEELFLDFKSFNGVQIPMKRLLKRNGQDFAATTVKEVIINAGVEDKIFTKP